MQIDSFRKYLRVVYTDNMIEYHKRYIKSRNFDRKYLGATVLLAILTTIIAPQMWIFNLVMGGVGIVIIIKIQRNRLWLKGRNEYLVKLAKMNEEDK